MQWYLHASLAVSMPATLICLHCLCTLSATNFTMALLLLLLLLLLLCILFCWLPISCTLRHTLLLIYPWRVNPRRPLNQLKAGYGLKLVLSQSLSHHGCMQEAAENALSMVLLYLGMQKAAGDAVSTCSQQFCMQEAAEEALSLFSQQLNTQYTANMTAKLGLQKYNKDIAVELLTNMYEDKTGVQQFLKAASAQLSPAATCGAAVHALCLSPVWCQPWCHTELPGSAHACYASGL